MYMTRRSFNLLKKMQCLDNTSITNESSSGFDVTCAEGEKYQHVYPKSYGEFAGPRNIATISIAKQYCKDSCEPKTEEND